MEVTKALQDYIDKRLKRLDKLVEKESEANVTISMEKGSQRIEVTFTVYGMIVRAEESTMDMYTSIDLVVDKLEKQIERYKGRMLKRNKSLNEEIVSPKLNETPKDVFKEYQIVRTKKFAFKPMDVEEAVLQMNLLGHSFFVFANSTTEQVNVVYKRKDGNVGLIEPNF